MIIIYTVIQSDRKAKTIWIFKTLYTLLKIIKGAADIFRQTFTTKYIHFRGP